MNDREHLSDDAIRRAFYVRKSRVSKQWTWSCRRLQISHAHTAGSASSQDTCIVVWLIGWYKQGSAAEADYISQPRTFVYNHETSTTDNGRLTTSYLRFRFLYTQCWWQNFLFPFLSFPLYSFLPRGSLCPLFHPWTSFLTHSFHSSPPVPFPAVLGSLWVSSHAILTALLEMPARIS